MLKVRFEWLEHMIRVDQTRVGKQIVESKAEGRRKVGGPRLRWLEDAQNDLWELKVKRWRPKANT
jgi:hypothetical protein